MSENKIIWTDKNGTTWTKETMTTDKALKIIFWANKLESGDINNTQKDLEGIFDILCEKTIDKLIKSGALLESGNRRSTLLEDAQNMSEFGIKGLEPKDLEPIPQKVKQYNSKTKKVVEVDLYPDKDVIWTCGDGTTKTAKNIDSDHLIRILYWLQGKDNKGAKGIGINDSNNVELIFNELKKRTITRLEKINGFLSETQNHIK